MLKKIIIPIAVLSVGCPMAATYSAKFFLDDSVFSYVNDDDLTVVGTVTINKDSIQYGESAVISWNFEQITSITIQGVGTFTSNTGSVNVSPTQSRTYLVTANNRSKQQTDTLSINVDVPPVDIVAFESDMRGILLGGKVNLSWNVANAAYVTISAVNTGGSSGAASSPSGQLSPSGTYLSNTGGFVVGDVISYRLTAYSLDGAAFDTADINIPVKGEMTYTGFAINNPPTSDLFGGSAVPAGGTLNLSWSGTNINKFVITAKSFSDPNGPPVLTLTVPNADAGYYNLPVNNIGDYTGWDAVAYSFGNVPSNPITRNTRVVVYQPTQVNTFTVNGYSDSASINKGTLNFAWTGTDPIKGFEIRGLESYPIVINNNSSRSASTFHPYAGTYNLQLVAKDYGDNVVIKNFTLQLK